MFQLIRQQLILEIIVCYINLKVKSQDKPSFALVNIDAHSWEWDNVTVANIMQFELEKVDKYDVTKVMHQNNVDLDHSFGKNSLVEVERLLIADKMLNGSAELLVV